jgi:hypothetical protein
LPDDDAADELLAVPRLADEDVRNALLLLPPQVGQVAVDLPHVGQMLLDDVPDLPDRAQVGQDADDE